MAEWLEGKQKSKGCGVGGSKSIMDKIFCNVHLFRVPRSWTGSVQNEIKHDIHSR